MDKDQRNRSYFALGCLWATLIAIVIAVVAFVWVLWWIGILGPAD
jgi:heme/copper-type cytochrome/quinol oxidase subunit 4